MAKHQLGVMAMSDSTDIEVSDDPWMSHAFISNLMTQVSLPYRRPESKEIVRHGPGHLTVTFSTSADCLPYGKYPRLFEMWACTMVKTGDECFDPETNTLNLGTTFREFLRLLHIEVGGRQLRTIKPQLERLFRCVYTIDNSTSGTTEIRNVSVADRATIDWLAHEPQEHALFENTVQLSRKYVDYLRDSPVPVDLSIVAQLNSPMALDVYWWLTHRYSYLHRRESIAWRRLYDQFGSTQDMKHFKQNFRKAVCDVRRVYPQAKIICGTNYVTLYPSATSVPTTVQTRASELLSKQARKRDEKQATTAVREVSEADIIRVVDRIDYGEDYVAVRRHVVHGLNAGLPAEKIIKGWNTGERL